MEDRSLWQRILDFLALGALAMRRVSGCREGTDSVTFSTAFIALAAKLAKADGMVTRDEVSMFRHIFAIPAHQEQNAARVYNLCRQDVTGFEFYAQQMSNTLGATGAECETRAAVLDGLFHIAMADGEYHPNEAAFLRTVAGIFGLADHVFARLQARHVPCHHDPWAVLG
ncbi:MAG: TerB family tellurite resistance protein, partial [Rhodobacteraceae bacterium]|nr:TerB family tellurite resistance protein [Paracoccaceae bacterium]